MQSLFFSAQGRLNRKAYWMGVLMLIGIEIVGAIVIGAISLMGGSGAMSMDGTVQMTGAQQGAMVLGGLLYLIILVMGLMLAVKRLHDRDRSGWFLLVALVPLLNIWVLIEVWFLPGTAGPNRFGPDPLPRVASPYQPA